MIKLFGEISLLLAFLFALMQAVLTLIGYKLNNRYLLAFARPTAFGQFILVFIAYLLLTWAFITDEFSLLYVASNSHPLLPFMYKLTAVWGAHEGSILLWILVLSVWTIAFAKLQKNNPDLPLVIAILGVLSFCFLSFLLFTSNPFAPATEFVVARDLNPLLQDPGLVSHPPMLYIGYVGFSAAFAITLAALISGNLNTQWAKVTRLFAIAAWCFLTLGITLGSWWAYRVLGWGGFWFWDPVENASLLPWIAGTALIHVLILSEKRNIAKGWASFLALICFALSLLGTFLVRSGVLVSAHTFANDPARGVFLLLLLGAILIAALTIYVLRINKISSSHAKFFWFSRETGLLLNSALLFVAMLTILIGTLYPLILDALELGVISVGAPYFNKVMGPLVLVVMLFMGFIPLCRFQEQSFKTLFKTAGKNILISIIAAISLLLIFTHQIDFMVMISLALSFWILLSLLGSFKSHPGMTLAHAGFAIFIIGIMLSTLLNQEREVRMRPGTAVNLGPYQFFFIETQDANGSNYRGIRATFEVIKNKKHIADLYPEKRLYTVREMVMTKVAIQPSIFRDLYIALGDPLQQGYWSVRIYYKPFVRWIWFGGFIMILGGIGAAWSRRAKMI